MTDKIKQYPEPIVGALIINKNGKLLFCRSQKWEGKFTIFGGHVEQGEKIEDAIVREVKEESGLDVKVIKNIGISDSIFNPKFHNKKHFIFIDFLCKYDNGDDEIKINREYENDYKWVTIDEAQNLDMADGAKLILKEYVESLKNTDYLSGWKRCQADFENYKRRQAEAQKDLIKYSTESIIYQILPVLDNFHSSTDHIPEDQKNNPWVTGIMHIQKQLEDVLKDNGVEEIKVEIGDDFSPHIHEAIINDQEIKTKEGKNKISKVVQKGYKIDGKVIRVARVIVN